MLIGPRLTEGDRKKTALALTLPRRIEVMPYGILAFALVFALPGVVVLAAVGANVYWISLVLKLRHLLNEQQEAVAA